MNLPDDLAEGLARAGERLGRFGGAIRWFAAVGSTSDIAFTWADHGAPEGAVVVADAQTAGRGRHGRSWVSPAGAGLYVSTVVRPSIEALPLLTIAAGVAVAQGIQAAAGFTPALKWPNDVYAGGRKLAGILAESAGTGVHAAPFTVVLGIGINLYPAAYPPDVAARATSLESELGRPVDRGLLLAEVLAALEEQYAALAGGSHARVVAEWRRRAAPMLGRRVQWGAGDERRIGVAFDIDDAGALLVRSETGTERLVSGEVVWDSEPDLTRHSNSSSNAGSWKSES